MNKKLFSFVLAAVLLLAAAMPALARQETCPQTDGWNKVDGLSGFSLTYVAPAGSLIVATCYKAANTVVYGVVEPPAQSVTVTSTVMNDNGQLQELSHASFLLITAPTSTPTTPPVDPTSTPTTPPVDPTSTPTTDPTATPTDQPTGTPEVTPTTPPVDPNCDRENGDGWLYVDFQGFNVGDAVRLMTESGNGRWPYQWYDVRVGDQQPYGLPGQTRIVGATLPDGTTLTMSPANTEVPACLATSVTVYAPVQPTPTENPVNPTGAGGDNGDDGTGGLLLIAICVALGLGAICSRKPVAAS